MDTRYVPAMPTVTEEKAAEAEAQTPHSLEAKVAELESLLKTERDKHDYQQRRADDAEKRLTTAQAKAKAAKSVTEDNVVILDGKVHQIVNTYRADNTNADVKRGYIPENDTLVHIEVKHAGFVPKR